MLLLKIFRIPNIFSKKLGKVTPKLICIWQIKNNFYQLA